MEWIKLDDAHYPDFEVDVLIYWKSSSGYSYREVAQLRGYSMTKEGKRFDFTGDIEPTHYCELPADPPDEKV